VAIFWTPEVIQRRLAWKAGEQDRMNRRNSLQDLGEMS